MTRLPKATMMNEVPASCEFLAKVLRACPEDSVLIGGQALEYWIEKYRLYDATSAERLTTDIDFLGSSDQSEELAERLSLKIYIPSLDDATPSTARLTEQVSADTFMAIDYLGAIAGLDNKLVARRAIGVSFGDTALRVMHPVDCLESRIANLALIPAKRTVNGIRQTEMAVSVVLAHLAAMIDSGCVRGALKETERIARIAVSELGKRVYTKWEIDVLEAIPHDALPEDFRIRRWPQLVEFVGEKRRRFKKLIERAGTIESSEE